MHCWTHVYLARISAGIDHPRMLDCQVGLGFDERLDRPSLLSVGPSSREGVVSKAQFSFAVLRIRRFLEPFFEIWDTREWCQVLAAELADGCFQFLEDGVISVG